MLGRLQTFIGNHARWGRTPCGQPRAASRFFRRRKFPAFLLHANLLRTFIASRINIRRTTAACLASHLIPETAPSAAEMAADALIVPPSLAENAPQLVSAGDRSANPQMTWRD